MLTAYTTQPMRAVVHDRYGATDVLRVEEIARPVPSDDESGAYPAVVDLCNSLEEVVAATRYVETEQKVGNVVLTLG